MISDYKKRLDYELQIITKMGYSGYFLIVSDFINGQKKIIYLLDPEEVLELDL